MMWRAVQVLDLGHLDDLAEVHHSDAIADVLHHGEVVGDEDIREPEFALQVLEQVDDLRLDGDVERRHRLITDDELRVQRKRSSDADALPLASREFGGKPVVVLGVESDNLHEPLHTLPALCAACDVVDGQGVADDRSHPSPGVERTYWALEDLFIPPPDWPHFDLR